MYVIIVFRRVAVKNNASNDWTMLRGICLIKEVYIRKSLSLMSYNSLES